MKLINYEAYTLYLKDFYYLKCPVKYDIHHSSQRLKIYITSFT